MQRECHPVLLAIVVYVHIIKAITVHLCLSLKAWHCGRGQNNQSMESGEANNEDIVRNWLARLLQLLAKAIYGYNALDVFIVR